jgi:serine/threonine protein phosphatase PrpC
VIEVAGRASIVGAALTHVGNVREHNEDAFFFDEERGMFLVCDGMGGHAAGEVASAIAVKTIRERWADPETQEVADVWLARGTAIAKKQLLGWLRDGVIAAHDAIIAEAERDPSKAGMGTTLVGGMVVGSELLFAHCGDSRAYIVRDGIAMQLTEDHTLLQRLLAAGIEVDVSGDGARFRSMLTNALGIGQECKVSTFVVPLADGDRFMLCSDGISEYVQEAEVGEVLTKQPSPARAAQKLVDLALERGGSDNATTIVVRVLEAGEDPVPSEQRRRDDLSISLCSLWTEKVSPQQRLRALRIAIPRDHAIGDKLPAHTLGDRVAWILVEGEVELEGEEHGPGSLMYPESLIAGSPAPDKDGLAIALTEVRAVAIRNDDWRELCEEDAELGEALLDGLQQLIATKIVAPAQQETVVEGAGRKRPTTGESAIDRAIESATTAPTPRVLERSETPEARTLGRASTPLPVAPGGDSDPEIQVVAVEPEPPIEPVAPPRKRTPTEPEIEISYGDGDDA